MLVLLVENAITKSEATMPDDISRYQDIINLSRPKSKRPKMSRMNRAAQFAPFAALSGHQAIIKSSEDSQKYDAENNTDFDETISEIF